MSLFKKPEKLSEPNELGYQFGIADDLTEYAHKEQQNYGTTLPPVKITVLEVWKNDKRESWLLMDELTNSPINYYDNFEACAAAIDIYKLKIKSKSLENNEK